MRAEDERLERRAAMRAIARRKNRDAGVPDMDVGDRHEPAEWFAQLGFFIILDKIGRSQPDHDWSEEGGYDSDHATFVEARRRDHERVAEWLAGAEIVPRANRHGMQFGGIWIKWPDRVPALKVWAGQQTLPKLAKQRQAALSKKVENVLTYEAGIKGASGIDRRCATKAIDDGFSVDALGMLRTARVGMELLAMIGLESVPITAYPDGSLGYDAGGTRWRFRIEDRNDYYGRWGTAERDRI